MTDDNANPYAAPAASIEPVQLNDYNFAAFPRWSAWWVLLLTIVTLGIYSVYWLYSRSQVINRDYKAQSIDGAFITVAVALFAVNWALSIAEGVREGLMSGPIYTSPLWAVASSLLGLISWIVIIYWSMKLKTRLNAILDIEPGDPRYASSVITFVLAIFSAAPIYLAYKINKVKDSV